ncbi:magnesium transporter CorA family protein [Christensenella timonensis]|uniref:magnesium transporter CorA family protein n=1 Tax=Christensenella timonensis TaxID=1816678 RepID=UPI00083164D1|nr:magnesium transporter CorA family protein [Christensenella timonensis]
MIRIFSTAQNNKFREIDSIEPGAWIHLLDPSEEEIVSVRDALHIEDEFIRAALDSEEAVRIDVEDDQTLVLVDIPVVTSERNSFVYTTLPMGIIVTADNIITVCLEETSILEDFWNQNIRGGFDTCKKTRFLLQILYKNASKYLQYLRQIDKASTQVENALHKSMKNSELIQMLKLEKSLVYFSTSLKSNEVVLEKMLKSRVIKSYPDDLDLLEDVIVENKQAIEMGTIYRDILSGTMDAFASVISNNLNIVMKILTSLTIILAIPTLFASLWGMNVPVPFAAEPLGFLWVIVIAGICSGAAAYILWKKKMF